MRTLIGVDDPITVRERRRFVLRHTFSGASLAPSDQGPSFGTSSGTPSVSGGVLTKVGTTTLEIYAVNVGSNIVMQAKVNFGNSDGAARRVQLRLRRDDVDAQNYFTLIFTRTDLELSRRDSGVATQLAFTSFATANSTNVWLRYSARGSRHEVWTSADGSTFTSRIVVTDAAYQTQTRIGALIVDNGTTSEVTIDDLLVWTS